MKRMLIALMAIVMISITPSVFGSISFDNANSNQNEANTTCTFDLDLAVDDFVVVGVGIKGTGTVTSITDEDTNTWTSQRIDDSGTERTELFTTIVTTTNTINTITINISPTSDIVCGGIVYTGVDTTNPVAEATGTFGTSSSSSLSLTVDADNAIVGIVLDAWNIVDIYSGTGTWNNQWDETNGGGNKFSGSSAEQVFTTAGLKTQTVDIGANRAFAHSMIEVNAKADDVILSESLSISDSLVIVHTPAPVSFDVTLTESLSITDVVNTTSHFQTTLTDSMSISDEVITSSHFKTTLTDFMTLIDEVNTQSHFKPILTDSISIIDVANTSTSFNIILIDLLSITDEIIGSTISSFEVTLIESLSLSDDTLVNTAFEVTLVDSMSITDEVITNTSFKTILTESLSLSDLVTTNTTSELSVTLIESLSLSDVINTSSNFEVNLIESLSLTDEIISNTTSDLEVTLIESLSLSDGVNTTSNFEVSLIESLSLTDEIVTNTTSVFEVILIESISITDSIIVNTVSHFEVTLTDSLSIIDEIIIVHTLEPLAFDVILIESLSVTDEIIVVHVPASLVLEITLVESLSVSDEIIIVHTPATGTSFKTLTNSISISDTIIVLLNGEPVGEIQVVTSGGGDSDHKWRTKPTFGKDHDNIKQIVVDGFILNGERITITDNFYTSYPIIELETGIKYKMSAKAYSPKGLKIVEFLFGMPEVGKAHEAEATIEVWLKSDNYPLAHNVTYFPVDKVINQKDNIINDDVVAAYTNDKCNNVDTMICQTVMVFLRFNETPLNNVFGIKAIDEAGRYIITAFNDGIRVNGESFNPPKKEFMAYGKLGLLEMTQVDKKNNVWTSPYGINYTRNNVNSWIQITPSEFPIVIDDWNVDTRMASYWNDMILLEQTKAKLVFDSSKIQKEEFEGGK